MRRVPGFLRKSKTNQKYVEKRQAFFESCKKRNSDLSLATIYKPENYERLTIGRNVIVNDAFLDLHGDIILRDNVFFGWGVKVLTGSHNIGYTGVQRQRAILSKSVKIDTGVWVASFAIILPGSSLGQDSVVSAGSIVKGTFPPKAILAGNPARVVGMVRPVTNHSDVADSSG